MRTVLFAYYLDSERHYEALEKEQGFDFVCSYKIRKGERTV